MPETQVVLSSHMFMPLKLIQTTVNNLQIITAKNRAWEILLSSLQDFPIYYSIVVLENKSTIWKSFMSPSIFMSFSNIFLLSSSIVYF